MAPAQAIGAVRAARRGTVETQVQEQYVLGLPERLSTSQRPAGGAR